MPKELIFDLARTQLASQKDDLRALRNQAGFMSATTGIIGAVFARLAGESNIVSQQGEIGVFGIGLEPLLVFVPFTFAILFAIRAVVVWRPVRFDQDVQDLNKRDIGNDESDEELIRNLANDLDACFVENEKTINQVKTDLMWAGISCFCQIPAWLFWIS